MATLLVGCGGGGGGVRDGAAPDRGGESSSPPPRSTATGKSVRALARSVPVGLRVPAIGVDTPVMKLGLAPDGSVEVPPIEADDRAGWYGHSPTPGQKGPSVILGHVTVGNYGDGVFRDLKRLRRGDRIEARLANGTAAQFTVSAVRTVPQAKFPTDDVYGDVGRPELRLITCGGPRSGDGYRDSVIVFAELSAGSGSP
ncbi:class F sortase [Streptomyces sp. NPDC102365]|uniref:class F sortase n=1 Tax=Streptomyces sp. NPDC102365 TaxID=3366162 RepID=UPI00380EAB04